MSDLEKLAEAATLKPCPFCGGDGYISREICRDFEGTLCAVECKKCGAKARGKYHSKGNDCPLFYEELRGYWNTRSGELVEQGKAVKEAREAAFKDAAAICQAQMKNAQENECLSQSIGAMWCRDAILAALGGENHE